MTKEELEDARKLWRMFYGKECFKQSRQAAQYLLDNNLDASSSTIYIPLVTSVYVLYGKPFKKSRLVGNLDERIVPAQYRDLHNLLITHRDKVYAHRDGNAFELWGLGPANQIRAVQTGNRVSFAATDFHARLPALPPIVALCKELEKKTEYQVDKVWQKLYKRVPRKRGEFLLNIQDEKGETWIYQKEKMFDVVYRP